MDEKVIELCKEYCYLNSCDCEKCPSLFYTCVDSAGVIRCHDKQPPDLYELREHIDRVTKFFDSKERSN